ncbi:hypothetical protein GOBAR_DD11430 [Gossypium barbadense]|nr:hypothetical protein GOBAR_DD11430 [Gossypium barbadense]
MPQPPQMIPVMPSYPPTNITTEQIQKYLDENKKLILAILDNQNLGKLAECAHWKWLVESARCRRMYYGSLESGTRIESYLDPNWDECSADMSEPCDAYTDAAIADAQPQSMPTMPPQMAPHPAIPTGGYFMQHPQAAAMAQQLGMYSQKVPLQFNNPHQMQDPQHLLHQQHQQAMQGQMGIRPGGLNNGMHPMHSEASLGGGSSAGPPQSSGPSDGRAGNKQNPETGVNGQEDLSKKKQKPETAMREDQQRPVHLYNHQRNKFFITTKLFTHTTVLPTQLDNFRVAAHCSNSPLPPHLVFPTILQRVFKGSSPYTDFPPPHLRYILKPKRIRGWGSNGDVFEHLIKRVKPKLIVEVGTFLGASALHMVNVTRKLGLQTQILCLDDFRGWPGFRDRFKDINDINGDVLIASTVHAKCGLFQRNRVGFTRTVFDKIGSREAM